MTEVTYGYARSHLAALCNQVVDDRDAVIIKRRGSKDVALVSAVEWASMLETLHLLRSPANAARLTHALERAVARTTEPESIDELRQSVGLDDPGA